MCHRHNSHLPWRVCWSCTARWQTERCWSRVLASRSHRTPWSPETCSNPGNLVKTTERSAAHWRHRPVTLPASGRQHTRSDTNHTTRDVYLDTWQSRIYKVRRRQGGTFRKFVNVTDSNVWACCSKLVASCSSRCSIRLGDSVKINLCDISWCVLLRELIANSSCCVQGGNTLLRPIFLDTLWNCLHFGATNAACELQTFI